MAATNINPSETSRAPISVVFGLTLTSMSVLIAQIALTRLMSVTVSYHSAFLILSVVMLGIAASAISVFKGMRFRNPPVTAVDSISAAFLSAIGTLLAALGFVFIVARNWGPGFQPIQIALGTALFFVCFYFSGYVIAVILGSYSQDISRLYLYDLIGAAGGCLLVVPLLNYFPAVNVIFLCAAATAGAGSLFSLSLGNSRTKWGGLVLTLTLVAVCCGSVIWQDWFRLNFAKGQDQSSVKWVTWNALARVSVTTEIPGSSAAIEMFQNRQGIKVTPQQIEELRRLWQVGWGISRTFSGTVLPTLWLQLDADAGTPILQNGIGAMGEKGKLDFLAWDVTAAGYSWRLALGQPIQKTFIIGGGGGRDVLTALSFASGAVDVVELNPAVVDAVENVFGDFSGRPYSHPRVHLTVGEARHELFRRAQNYDLIQMSMIDTWASSMAGTLVMTENSLYTQEAFDLYFSHLQPDGILSVSRWFDPVRYGESARVAVMMAETLRRAGVKKPQEHIAMLTCPGYLSTYVASMLLKRSPITQNEQVVLQKLCESRGFNLLWPQITPNSTTSFDLGNLLRLDSKSLANDPFDLSSPSDDRPFFFNIDRPIQSWVDALKMGDFSHGSRATLILGAAFIGMMYACILFLVKPIQTFQREHPDALSISRPALIPHFMYFGGIGLGFMLIEVALIQRYILFLGHPSHSISVVLFALLLFGSGGSFLTSRFDSKDLIRKTQWALTGVMAATLLTAWVLPCLLEHFAGGSWIARLFVTLVSISPLALLMGMICPLGIRNLTETGRKSLVPWMWGINGICGVIASTLGMMLAMTFSYTIVLVVATLAYGITFASLLLSEPNNRSLLS
ncbi:MAG: hypothetical protein HQM08_15175 [Candidatus Riflebacteria bacterium]|nr:hypothetical protein [Candidatus Riflebacteria bacterium]